MYAIATVQCTSIYTSLYIARVTSNRNTHIISKQIGKRFLYDDYILYAIRENKENGNTRRDILFHGFSNEFGYGADIPFTIMPQTVREKENKYSKVMTITILSYL